MMTKTIRIALVAVVLSVLQTAVSHAATQIESGNTAADNNSFGSNPWTPTGGALPASALAGSGLPTHYLVVTNFGFNLPPNVIITGIEVAVNRSSVGDTGVDAAVRLVKGGLIGSTDESSANLWPTSTATENYGAPNDLWGDAWDPGDIVDPGFGVAIAAGTGGAKEGVTVSAVGITVHFVGCPPSADYSCDLLDGSGLLILDGQHPGKEKLTAKMKAGPSPVSPSQTDYGNPLVANGTAYALCFYNDVAQLSGQLLVNRGGQPCDVHSHPCWKPIGASPPLGKGYKFKDPNTTSDGAAVVVLKALPATPKVVFKAANSTGHLPPGLPGAMFGSSATIVELFSSDGQAPGCVRSGILSTIKSTSVFYKAK